jgi:hypothetical protein
LATTGAYGSNPPVPGDGGASPPGVEAVFFLEEEETAALASTAFLAATLSLAALLPAAAVESPASDDDDAWGPALAGLARCDAFHLGRSVLAAGGVAGSRFRAASVASVWCVDGAGSVRCFALAGRADCGRGGGLGFRRGLYRM